MSMKTAVERSYGTSAADAASRPAPPNTVEAGGARDDAEHQCELRQREQRRPGVPEVAPCVDQKRDLALGGVQDMNAGDDQRQQAGGGPESGRLRGVHANEYGIARQ